MVASDFAVTRNLLATQNFRVHCALKLEPDREIKNLNELLTRLALKTPAKSEPLPAKARLCWGSQPWIAQTSGPRVSRQISAIARHAGAPATNTRGFNQWSQPVSISTRSPRSSPLSA